MNRIKVQRNLSSEQLHDINNWPIWEKESSTFPWTYADSETCYLLEGDVTVTTEDGEKVTLQPGDFVTFPAGMSCTWEIRKPVRKHYSFG